jgi:hypothetical protein
LEARVILACVMRRYDFVNVEVGETETDKKGRPIVDEKGRYRTKSELLSVSGAWMTAYLKTTLTRDRPWRSLQNLLTRL